MSDEDATPNQKWTGALYKLRCLETKLLTHILECDESNIHGRIRVCCSDLVIEVQKAKDMVDATWKELYRISVLGKIPI
jgi:hypothetical protein